MDFEKSHFTEQTSTFDSFELHLNNEAKDVLRSAANWGMGFAIIGFIGCGFLVLAALVMIVTGEMQNGIPTSSMGLLYLLMALMYFLPMLFLAKFSTSTKRALNENNTHQLSATFRNLKNHFMSAVISVIVIFVASIIFGIMLAASVAGAM